MPMLIATEARPMGVPPPRPPTCQPGRRTRRVARIAAAAVGLGVMLIVLDGSWWWATVRVLLVGAVVWMAMDAAEHRSRRAVGLAAATLGLVGLAAGGAISISYWPASGSGVRAVGGL